jgi:RNA polymerase sigma factor (sigma-70 family)
VDAGLYARTESTCYRYYRDQAELAKCQQALQKLEQRIEDTRKILLDVEKLIPSIGVVGNYSPVGGNRGGQPGDPTVVGYSSYQQTVEELNNKLAKYMKRKISLRLRILELESELEAVELALGTLKPEERKIIEQRYLYRRSNQQVGSALGMDEGTVRYRRRVIVEKVARALSAQ